MQLFSSQEEHLPLWFKKYDWGVAIDHHKTSFLPPDLGMVDVERKTFSVKVSSQPLKLLLDVMPEVAKEECFAMHGGTAINLFVREMPRLSVDIDLTYRETFLM